MKKIINNTWFQAGVILSVLTLIISGVVYITKTFNVLEIKTDYNAKEITKLFDKLDDIKRIEIELSKFDQLSNQLLKVQDHLNELQSVHMNMDRINLKINDDIIPALNRMLNKQKEREIHQLELLSLNDSLDSLQVGTLNYLEFNKSLLMRNYDKISELNSKRCTYLIPYMSLFVILLLIIICVYVFIIKKNNRDVRFLKEIYNREMSMNQEFKSDILSKLHNFEHEFRSTNLKEIVEAGTEAFYIKDLFSSNTNRILRALYYFSDHGDSTIIPILNTLKEKFTKQENDKIEKTVLYMIEEVLQKIKKTL